jgi:hypothetical protein
MSKLRVAFWVLDDDKVIPPTYQDIQCHMVYDAKMEDFRRKARFVAGGHMTETPASNTYASVVSRESVCITLSLAVREDTSWSQVSQACFGTIPNWIYSRTWYDTWAQR